MGAINRREPHVITPSTVSGKQELHLNKQERPRVNNKANVENLFHAFIQHE